MALNFMLVIGGIVLLIIVFVFSVVTWTGISALIWVIQRRRAQREFMKRTRREDGKSYPAHAEGTCGCCGRGSRKIYFPPSGEELCPVCYEQFWRHVEGHASG